MAETNNRPFWTDDKPWKKSQLPPVPEARKTDEIVSAVPTFTSIESGDVLAQYTRKDGLLLFQFFHRVRKDIFDSAEQEMANISENTKSREQATILQQEVANKANAEMAKNPWWPQFEAVLKQVFADRFKYQPTKVNFYNETDSWSVALPEPSSPGVLTDEYLNATCIQVAALVSASQG